MANHSEQSRRSILRGPSTGLVAWTAYWMAVLDWLIDARKRWHHGNVRQNTRVRLTGTIAVMAPVVAVLGTRVL